MVSTEYKKAFMKLMKEEEIQLPRRSGKTYTSSLELLFRSYLEKLTFLSEAQQKEIKEICDLILVMASCSVKDVMQEHMEDLMENKIKQHIRIIKDCLPIDGFARKNVNLFRVRKITKNCEYERTDIFHQPISSFQYIQPYRYNIEGCPSLYVSSTIYNCLKEANINKDDDLVIGSLFRLDTKCKDLFIVDLGIRPIDFIKDCGSISYSRMKYSYLNYLYVYPLIAACSFIVADHRCLVVPEYQISNALLRWLIKHHNEKLCGIRYFSCSKFPEYRIDLNHEVIREGNSRYSFTKYFINYVFPIENLNKDKYDYSLKLGSAFLVGKPCYKDNKGIKEFENYIKYDTKSLEKIMIKEKITQ